MSFPYNLDRLRRKESRKIIGLMSGTSADGVSVAIVEVEGCWTETKLRLLAFRNYPYPESLRKRIFELFNPKTSTVDKICWMNFILGHFFADCVKSIIKESGLSPEDIDLIGSHGQTIYHIPDPVSMCGYESRATLQIGELAIIAEETGITTIGDFRKRDVAAGGEGAPLTPYMDFILHKHPSLNRIFQNIGGIANLTFIPASGSPKDLIAFDTGPGNMVIDALMEYYTGGRVHYDKGGEVAARGRVDDRLLSILLDDPYFRRKPPKSTGRELFGRRYTLKIIEYAERHNLRFEDVIATATALTVESMVMAYERFIMPRHKIDEIYISGGGSKNRTIMRWLRERLDGIKVLDYSSLGIPSEAKEAVLMAILANEFLMGRPSNMTRATGAKRNVILGTLVPGKI